MIRIFQKGEDLTPVLTRSQLDFESVNGAVADIIANVRARRDAALLDYAEKFDGYRPKNLIVSEEEISAAYQKVDAALLASLRKAKENIYEYHRKQLVADGFFDDGGRKTGYVMRPVERAGIYIPGGTAAYPSSVLMTAVTAAAAGVKEIYMVTPERACGIHPLTLVAARECGVKEIYKTGGAQAIAALAFGTESVKRADVIAGPGNIFVTVAKKQVYGYVGVDMIAGPSEVLVIADETANPKFLAADLLSQAEHDKLSVAILITTSEKIAVKTREELEAQLKNLTRQDIAREAIEANSAIIVVEKIEDAIAIANQVAPEHLELCFKDAREKLDLVKNAGAVFLGNYSPEPLGDYFAGPNHVLPTGGTARYFSVLNALTFIKRISVIEYGEEQLLSSADDVIRLAESEGLSAHANSIRVRKEEREHGKVR